MVKALVPEKAKVLSSAIYKFLILPEIWLLVRIVALPVVKLILAISWLFQEVSLKVIYKVLWSSEKALIVLFIEIPAKLLITWLVWVCKLNVIISIKSLLPLLSESLEIAKRISLGLLL